MIVTRKAGDRGRFNHGWLDTAHTFSFSRYQDDRFMGFRALRVINEDRIEPGKGFGRHGHRDMEILTYVLEGALEHRDSLGSGEVLRPSEFQRMSAGTGIEHSEFNASSEEPVHLYQIWLFPDRQGLTPSYEQRRFDPAGRANRLQLVAAPGGGGDGALAIHQDAAVYLLDLEPGKSVTHGLTPGRHAWVQVLRGSVRLNGQPLETSDGAAVSAESVLELSAGPTEAAELLIFDLA